MNSVLSTLHFSFLKSCLILANKEELRHKCNIWASAGFSQVE
uniref:Uncharacterized protein n=1 Tax=Anguilla anguilla TaxID=7936 RepID=A0A0E9UW81_ANGAN